LVFQRNSLSSSAINSRTVRRGWRLRTAAIMSTRVSPLCWLALRATDCARPHLRVVAANLSAAPELLFAHALPSGSPTLSASWRLARLQPPEEYQFHRLCWPEATRQLQLDRTQTIHPPLQSFESIAPRLGPLVMQCWAGREHRKDFCDSERFLAALLANFGAHNLQVCGLFLAHRCSSFLD
jgi:hypothetical protein